VATNAAGARSHKHGAVRDWVESIEFVTAEGEVGVAGSTDPASLPNPTGAERRLLRDVVPVMVGHQLTLERAVPATRKNSSGYLLALFPDAGWVRHLLIGSEGTLAIITAVETRLAPLPDEPTTLLVTLRSLDDLAPAVLALEPLGPAAVELLDRTYLDFVRAAASSRVPSETEAVLLVEFEGPATGAEQAVAGIASSTVLAESPEAAARLWELRHLASPILAGLPDSMRSLQVVEDGCVPLPRLADYVTGLRAIAAECGFEIVIFGHAGDGHVHANLLADVKARDLAPRLARCLAEASGLQIALGGTLAGEHGDGRLRAPFLERRFGTAYVEVCRRVKQAFDPAGILNPGVKLAEPSDTGITAQSLKVGSEAPAVPAAAAQALREIERTAAYGVSRLELLENGS
jgi:FAD/FMN-containing dehydrogenase